MTPAMRTTISMRTTANLLVFWYDEVPGAWSTRDGDTDNEDNGVNEDNSSDTGNEDNGVNEDNSSLACFLVR